MRYENISNGLRITHSEPITVAKMIVLGALDYFRIAIIPSQCNYLTGVAANFGKYRWRKLVVRYVPSCPATTEGEVALGMVYDRQDANAATFVQTAQLDKGIAFPPWGGFNNSGGPSITMTVDTNKFDKQRYSFMGLAAFNALSSSDQNNYCPATFCVATQGSTVAVTVAGRVWLDYSIELMEPISSGVNA